MDRLEAERQVRVFKALSDPTRLRMVALLLHHPEMSGTEIAGALGISMALLCHHTSVLAQAGVVRKQRRGQSAYCSLRAEELEAAIGSLLRSPARNGPEEREHDR